MKYQIRYHYLALKDLYKLDKHQQEIVLKAINKVSQNPASIH